MFFDDYAFAKEALNEVLFVEGLTIEAVGLYYNAVTKDGLSGLEVDCVRMLYGSFLYFAGLQINAEHLMSWHLPLLTKELELILLLVDDFHLILLYLFVLFNVEKLTHVSVLL